MFEDMLDDDTDDDYDESDILTDAPLRHKGECHNAQHNQ